jgi:CheY-like chemotaxis protein
VSTILIVDDSITMRKVLGDAVRAGGWQVDLVATAQEALQRARHKPALMALCRDQWVVARQDGTSMCQYGHQPTVHHRPWPRITLESAKYTIRP